MRDTASIQANPAFERLRGGNGYQRRMIHSNVGDFDRVRYVRGILQVDRDDHLLAWQSAAREMRTQLHEKQPRGLRRRAPIGYLSEATNLLQHLHYFHSGRHPRDACSSRAMSMEIPLGRCSGF